MKPPSFLRAASFAFALLAAAPALSQPAPESRTQVIVIGAGIAGLSVADELKRQGLTDVLVLESTSRTGGKMWTERPEGPVTAHYERGAELVNSSDEALIALLRRHGVGLVERRFVREERHETFLFHERLVGADGTVTLGPLREFTPGELVGLMNANDADRAILRRLLELQSQRRSDDPAVRRRALETLRSADGMSFVDGGHYTKSFLEALLQSEFGVSLRDVHGEVLLDYLEIPVKTRGGKTFYGVEIIPSADERFRIEGGTDTIIRKLTGVHRDRIRTSTSVVGIEQLAPDHFAIRAESTPGSGEIVTYHAENVVYAAPAYELAAMDIRVPELDPKRLKRAAALPFGSNAKIFLHFDEKFWDHPRAGKAFTGVGLLESGVQFWDTSEDQKDRRGGVITLYPGDWPEDAGAQERRLADILADIKTLPAFRDLDRHLLKVDQQIWRKSYAGVFNPDYQRAVELFGETRKANFFFAGSDKDNDRRGAISATYGYMDGAVRTAQRAARRILKNSGARSCGKAFAM